MGQIEKMQQFYLGEKEEEAIAAFRSTVIHNAENLGVVPMERTSDKESTMDQELANCNKVYDIATYNRRQFCVTIKKKYNVKRSAYFQIRLFTAKNNESGCLRQLCFERIQRIVPNFGRPYVC